MYDWKYYKNLQIDIPLSVCKNELNQIKKYNGNHYLTTNNKNETVLHYQWQEFYKKELELWNNKDIQFKLISNRVKYIQKGYGQISAREILRGFKISGLYVGNSFHSSLWIKGFIEDYNVQSIYDPCGGWGHRLIGSVCSKKPPLYIYNDINTSIIKNIYKMVEELQFDNIKIYNNDAEFFIPNEDYECVFTCPPYWNIEKYCDNGAENLSYKDFLEWWNNVIKYSVKKSTKYFVYIINNKLSEDMNKICINNNLELLEQKELGNKFNHFQRHNNSYKKREIMNIFKKIGDK